MKILVKHWLRRIALILAGAMFLLPNVQASAQGIDDERERYPEQYTMTPQGVNLQTGQFSYSLTSFSVGSLTYQFSMSPTGLQAGSHWHDNFAHGMKYTDKNNQQRLTVYVGGQTFTFFSLLSAGGHLPVDHSSQGVVLEEDGNIFFITNHSGTLWRIDRTQLGATGYADDTFKVVWMIRGNGSREDYTYDASGRLRTVTTNTGFALVFDYDASGRKTAVCGFNLVEAAVSSSSTCAGAKVGMSFGYDAAGSLTNVTDAAGAIFGISPCITRANSSTCVVQNTYGPDPANPLDETKGNQVRYQIDIEGGRWEYGYEPEPRVSADSPYVPGRPRLSFSHMKDPQGRLYGATYDRGQLIEFSGPEGSVGYRYASRNITIEPPGGLVPVQYSYFDVRPALVTNDGNIRDYFRHDLRGNIVEHATWPTDAAAPSGAIPTDPDLERCCFTANPIAQPPGSVVLKWSYLPDYAASGTSGFTYSIGCGAGQVDAKLCDKPLTRTDALGRVTEYTYDQATGLLLSETGPADPNGVRPQTRYSYTQRHAWTRNSGGTFVRSAFPVTLLTAKSLCKTSAATGNPAAPCAAGASDEVRTLYEYGPDSGPNNLLLRGTVEDATGLALRSCVTYDWRGNKLSETRPVDAAVLGVCP